MKQIGLFEMRRLEMLSNTIFGVAMTLLAYDLPKASSFKSAPNWIDLLNIYAQPVIALMISFIVAGMFWFSHHRRLVVAPEGSRGVVFLNLLFLLSIILLPVTNGLYGGYRLDGVVAVMYGIHLTTIATLNALFGFSRFEVAAIPSCWQTRSFRSSHSCSQRWWLPSLHSLRNLCGAWPLARLWRAGWRPGPVPGVERHATQHFA